MNNYDQDDPFGMTPLRLVKESWRLANGSVAHIHARAGCYAAGIIDGSGGAVHIWTNGKTGELYR